MNVPIESSGPALTDDQSPNQLPSLIPYSPSIVDIPSVDTSKTKPKQQRKPRQPKIKSQEEVKHLDQPPTQTNTEEQHQSKESNIEQIKQSPVTQIDTTTRISEQQQQHSISDTTRLDKTKAINKEGYRSANAQRYSQLLQMRKPMFNRPTLYQTMATKQQSWQRRFRSTVNNLFK